MSESNPSKIKFADLPLSEAVQQAVAAAGYESPTPIQAEMIPHLINGHDVIGQAQTGTGKTAAFALPLLSKISETTSGPQILVLAPTRELAVQVAKSFKTYAGNIPDFRVVAIFGGQDYEIQLRALKRGTHVVVGTPGRIIDHINRGTLKLDSISHLVLDEADEMLNMGFQEEVETILAHTPDAKQVALFSATMPAPIRKIADNYLKNPVEVKIMQRTLTAESVVQRCIVTPEGRKLETLSRILETENTDGVIVFTKTKQATLEVSEHLLKLGFSTTALNGDLPQHQRQRSVDQLKAGMLDILVATDVAARGLDVQRISHVINFDLPQDSEAYVHRIGRTGRAGRKGTAILFLTPKQKGRLRQIERITQQRIEMMDSPTIGDVNRARVSKFQERISDAVGTQDLSFFQNMLNETAEGLGQPVDIVAAAAVWVAQGNRPFLKVETKERVERSFSSERGERDRDDSRGGRKNGRRRDDKRRDQDRDFEPRRRGGRSSEGPKPGMQRFRIEVGRSDGVRPGNIVGAIANETGIAGEDINNISIGDRYTTLDLPEGLPNDLLGIMKKTWVSGKQLQISLATNEDQVRSFRPRSNDRKNKKFGKKGKPNHKGKRTFSRDR
ncbi:MAG: DEAD/DEAH box helicase [Pirellulaceae bacterium]